MFANPKIGRSSEKQNINELRQDFLERKIDHNFSNSKISNKTLKLPKINRMSAENIVYDRNNIFRQSQSKYKGQLGDSLRLSSANKNPSPKKSAENKNIILQKKKYESPNIFINRKQNVSEMTKSKLNFNEPKSDFIKKSPSRIGLKSQKEKQLAFEPILDTKGDILNLNPESFSRVNTSNTQKKQKLTVSQSQKIMSGKIYNIAQSDEPTINRYASIKNLSKLKNEDFIKFRNLINNREKVQEKYADYQIDTKLDANNNVVYRGCIVAGKKSGFGKEYYPETQILKYEGTFNNDVYHGQGKLFDEEGIIKASGNFVNGETEGLGQLYYPMGHLQYKGQISRGGTYMGQGTYYHKNGKPMYVGEFKSGQRCGFGKEMSNDGKQLYEGLFQNNQYNGKGMLYHSNGHKYLKGNFQDGKMNGIGMEFNDKGNLYYAGNFEKNLPTNYGVQYDGKDNVVYKGNSVEGKRMGEGTLFRPNDGSIIYKGNFDSNQFNGVGELFYRDGQLLYKGNFKNNLREGEGTEYHQDGSIGYKGIFKSNNFYGKGTLFNKGGVKTYEGDIVNGQRNGRGSEFDKFGYPIYVGFFKDDVYNGKGVTSFAMKDPETGEISGDYFNDFAGVFKKGVRYSGKIMYRGEQIFYEGKLKDEMPDGSNVTLYHENGSVLYQGNMRVGYKHGQGKTFYMTGALKYMGVYNNNEMENGALYNKNGKLKARQCTVQKVVNTEKSKNIHCNSKCEDEIGSPEKSKIEPQKAENSKESSKRHVQMLEKNIDQINEPMNFKGRLNLQVTRASPQDLPPTKNTKESSRKVSNISTTRYQSELYIVPQINHDKKSNKKTNIVHGCPNWYIDYSPNGNFKYQGSKNKKGEYTSYGTLWYKDSCSKEYEGQWFEGMKHGSGIEYYKQNIVFTIAKYYKDNPEGRIVILYNNQGKLLFNGGLIKEMKSW